MYMYYMYTAHSKKMGSGKLSYWMILVIYAAPRHEKGKKRVPKKGPSTGVRTAQCTVEAPRLGFELHNVLLQVE